MKKKKFGVCGRNKIAVLSMAAMMLLGGLNLQAQKSNVASVNANAAVAAAGGPGNTTPETVRSEWKKLKGDITLYMANDLGRNGYYDQKPIAELMGEMGEVLGPKCV
ncbi:MAG: acid phosphatase, partial [Prevotella pectinovora]